MPCRTDLRTAKPFSPVRCLHACRRHRFGVFLGALLLLSACSRGTPVFEADRPRLTSSVHVIDTQVHSAALGRDMPLRIVVPADARLAAQELPVVYLLHGAGTNLHDWTNHSDIAAFAAKGFVLVFPDAPGSYYIDDLRSTHNRYEQYLTREVVQTVHSAVSTASYNPARCAVVGISRGGWGAVVLGLKHPELFRFIGDLSGALDFDLRHFRWKHPVDSSDVDRAFGPRGSRVRQENNVARLLAEPSMSRNLYIFIACGEQDSLYDLNRSFAQHVAERRVTYEAHFAPGGHTWAVWGSQVPALEAALATRLNTPTAAAGLQSQGSTGAK